MLRKGLGPPPLTLAGTEALIASVGETARLPRLPPEAPPLWLRAHSSKLSIALVGAPGLPCEPTRLADASL